MRIFILIGIVMTASSLLAAEPTGASAAFTSNDPAIVQALDLIKSGDFAKAQSQLASDDGQADRDVARAREELKDVIHRIRIEYATDAPGLLKKLRKSIPDVTQADLDKWTKSGDAQHRVIDGKVMYFNREPANIFRFCEEAKKRREAAGNKPKDDNRWKLVDHLKQVVEAAEKSGDLEVMPIKHHMEYTLTIPANAQGVKQGSTVRVWLPFPQEYRQQKDVKLISTTPKYTTISPVGIDDGKGISGSPQRTIYFEQKVEDPTKDMTFNEIFEYTAYSYYPKLDDAKVEPPPADWGSAYLTERPPHIAFTPELRKTVEQIIGGETNPLAKVRKIFRWIDKNIAYHAEDEYGTIDSFASKAFRCKRGDCGIQSTLFITMCRIAGVPARWQSGWESKPIGWTMHDWTEFYVAPYGWLPADPSYGIQDKSDDPKVQEFYIGHQDSYRLIVNLDYGRDLVPPKPSLRSEPADFQRGEIEVDGKNLYFDQWDYEMKIVRNPGPNLE